MPGQFLEQDAFLPFIDPLHRLQHLHPAPVLLSAANQGLDVFRETGTAVSAARIEEFVPDAAVRPDSLAHHIDVRSHGLAQIGHVVDETDTRGQHGIRGVFGHLGRRNIHEHHPEIIQQQRFVKFRHQVSRPFGIGAHHHAVGSHEILDGIAFLEEFRIGSHVERHLYAALVLLFPDGRTDFGGRPHRNGRFRYHKNVTFHIPPDGAGHLQHVAQIRRSVFVGRRAHGRKNDFHFGKRFFQRRGEVQTSRFVVLLDQQFQIRLVNGNDPAAQPLDFRSVGIHAGNVYSQFRETGSGHQTDITRPYDGYLHGLFGI